MPQPKKNRQKTFAEFLKINKALNHFPTEEELRAFPGGQGLYRRIVHFWGKYSDFKETFFPGDHLEKIPGNLTIMIIFPGKELMRYVLRFLSKRRYPVIGTSSPKEALQKLADCEHVLAVIDKDSEKEAAEFIDKLHSMDGQAIILETPFASEFLEAQVIQAIQNWPERSKPLN